MSINNIPNKIENVNNCLHCQALTTSPDCICSQDCWEALYITQQPEIYIGEPLTTER